MKRISFWQLMSIVLLALVFLSSPIGAQTKKISILTWNIPSFKPVIDGWIEEFRKLHPEVEVEWLDKKGTDWATFYQTQVAGGNAPDIVDIQGALWLEYAAQGGMVDLTPYLERDSEVKASFTPEVLNTMMYEEKYYMVPFYRSKTLLFYNKIMFQEAGLEEPPQTFDQILEYARKMTQGEKSGFITLNFDWLYWPLFAVNGVQLLTPDGKKAAFNTPEAVKTLEVLAKATQEGAIAKISWTGRWVEPNNAFASGNIGMFHAHSPAFNWFRGEGSKWVNAETLGVAHFPGGYAVPNTHGLGISRSSKHPDLAWEMIKLITSDKWAKTFGSRAKVLTGNVRADAQLMKEFAKEDPLIVKVLQTQLEHLNKMVATWPNPKDAQIKEAFYPEIQNALFGRKSAAEALADAERKVNRILRR